MRGRYSYAVLLAAALSIEITAISAAAQSAKEYYEKALSGSGDQCQAMQDACKAAELDPKKKDYRQACDNSRGALQRSDRASLKESHEAFESGKFSQASRLAKYVCKANSDLFAEAQQLLGDIQKSQVAVNVPPKTPTKVDSPAPVVPKEDPVPSKPMPRTEDTPPKPQPPAPQKPPENPPAPHPADTSGNLGKTVPASGPTGSKQPTPAKPPQEDPAVTVARLLADAEKAKAAGRLQDAFKEYEAVLRLQPANNGALSGKAEVQHIFDEHPQEQAKTLAQAIRDFYANKFPEAEGEFLSYLASGNGTSRGAANFYLAATRLSRLLLENPSTPQNVQAALHNSEVQRFFRQARDEHYMPIERYISPVIMNVWRRSNESP